MINGFVEVLLIAGSFFVLGMYIVTQIDRSLDRNKLEKNLKEYEQKKRKEQSQTGASK